MTDRLHTGAILLVGRVGEVNPPHLILPLTVGPYKPRLCHDARFVNLWIKEIPLKLDTLLKLPRYLGSDTPIRRSFDDKSGYDHLLLMKGSRTFFGL